MKARSKKLLSLALTVGMLVTSISPAITARAEGEAEAEGSKLVGEIQTERYVSGDKSKPGKEYPDDENSKMTRDTSEFMKISHPKLPPNRRDYDPTVEDDPETSVDENAEARKKHADEVKPDGLIDYLGNGKLSEPKDDGVGDRGQSYSWTGISHGDWMYVSTQFNSAGSTGDIMGRPANPEQADKRFGGDYFTGEEDGGNPGSTLSKINVKTGETVILMAASKNGLDAQFRASIEYNGKLYFCGSVNHVPSIYEVDPTNDALKCVYRDPSMINYPGNPEKNYPAGVKGAWMEAKGDKNICPAIRGITTFDTGKKKYLVISCVGVDENPYIAISDNPSSGKFNIIAHAWNEVPKYLNDGYKTEGGTKGELFGYPACHLRDSIFGGSIWEMVQFDGKLYVAMCTGTPATAETHQGKIEDKDGNEVDHTFIDTMQSFALVCGEYDPSKDITSKDAWTWTPVVGDERSKEEGGDGAKYTFGIDPERTRSGACNLVVFDDHLYVGEYNDTQIAFINMNNKDFKFLKRNLEQSISYYRMDKDQNFTKVMGSPTELFPNTVVDNENYKESGFGQKSSQYIWQSRVFDGKLYFGTFDETMILTPLAKEASKNMEEHNKKMAPELEAVSDMIDSELEDQTTAEESSKEVLKTASLEEINDTDPEKDEFIKLKEVRDDFNAMKENGQVYALDDIDTQSGTILVPAGTTERDTLVNIESTEDLYLALLVLDDVMKTPSKGGVAGELTKFSDCVNLQREITTYAADPANEVPEYMDSAVGAASGNASQQEAYEEMQYIVKNLEGCVAGFDMYVSEDGTNFKQITRSGLGDPYNQGLRAFAANESADNKWMCIGSANGFWGTSIYRMNTGVTEAVKDPAQKRVKLKFTDSEGADINIDPDKSPEVYVNAEATTLIPKTVAGISPVNYQPAEPDKPVDIVEGVADIKVKPNAYADINYKDGENLIKTASVPHTKGNKSVAKKYIEQNMPEGYGLIDPNDKFLVNNSPTEGRNDFVDVQVGKIRTITIENGKADKKEAPHGITISIKADAAPEGKAFDKWIETTPAEEGVEHTPVTFADESKAETTFVMPDNNVTLKATYYVPVVKYKVTVEGGTSSVAEAAKGETVTITADKAPEGQEFAGWTGEDIEFADAKSAKTTFVMLEKDVSVKANFRDIKVAHKIHVKGGKSDLNKASEGETVTVKAEVANGKKFVEWVSEDVTFADAKSAETTFIMPDKEVHVEAVIENKNGWEKVGNDWYYYDDGEKHTGWLRDNGNWYYFNTAGVMAKGWLHISGPSSATYYFSESGAMVTGWAKIEDSWYYFNPNNGERVSGWYKVGNTWYYSNSSGVMQTGWHYINGVWYYFRPSGAMATGWTYISGSWYYMNSSGAMKTGWAYISGSWYYMNSSGAMQTGWVYISGSWYYMNSSGVMQTGWVYINGNWYYMNSSGVMKTGWQKISNIWYYFYSDGHMAKNTTIDGCHLNSSGAWA